MSLCVAITDSNIQCGHQRELWCISRQMLRTIISVLLRHWVHENVRSTRHNMQRKISILLKHIFMQIMVYTNFVFSTLYFYFAQPHFSFFPIGSGKLYLNYKCCDIVMTWTDVVMYCCHVRLGYEKQCFYIYIYIFFSNDIQHFVWQWQKLFIDWLMRNVRIHCSRKIDENKNNGIYLRGVSCVLSLILSSLILWWPGSRIIFVKSDVVLLKP